MLLLADENRIGKRIDIYLSENIKDLSRSLVQKLIKEEKILVNDNVVKSSYKLQMGDSIYIIDNYNKTTSDDLIAENIDIDIIYEDDDIIIVNKPKNMVVHPGSGINNGTLVNAILGKYNLSSVGEDFRPGIIHRLDKNTTGALVIAKNNYAHLNIANQIKNRTTKKIYIALVNGIIKENQGVIDMPIGRSTIDRKKMSVVKDGKNAITNFKVLKRYKEGYTLLEIELKTGRTHQIRVHMSQIGHSVVGDSTYSSGKNPFGIDSQMLHSYKLGFIHPTKNEYMEFEAPIPNYFKDIIDSLNTY